MPKVPRVTAVPSRRVLALRGKRKGRKVPLRVKKASPRNRRRSESGSRRRSESSSEYYSESENSSENESEERSESDSDDDDESYGRTDDEDNEVTEEYCRGGYHPVRIGDIYNSRYKVLRKLGWGYFSTVWLCWDLSGRRHVALKVVKSDEDFSEHAVDEIKLLACTAEADEDDPNREKIVQLFDNFKVNGVHGTHYCMVFEVLGKNLLALIHGSNGRGIPLANVKTIMQQLLEALDYLHRKCNIIHTDLKPENVLLCADWDQVRRLAEESEAFLVPGARIPSSAVTSAPDDFEKVNNDKMSKNKKKKLKLKNKKQPKADGPAEEFPCGEQGDENRSESEAGPSSSTKLEDEENVGTSAGDGDTVAIDANNNEVEELSQSFPPDPSNEICEISIKIADLGNACWADNQFTDDIQTRQYRCPEVLTGSPYGTAADMWSAACIAFEIATGDTLFDPHSGRGYSRDEDHLAQMIELLGPIPRKVALGGKYSCDYFTRRGELRHIKNLKPWKLYDVLIEKYDWESDVAQEFVDFLNPMMAYDPAERSTASQSLTNPWLYS